MHDHLLVVMIQGLLNGSAFRLTGVPYSVLWGVVKVFGALG